MAEIARRQALPLMLLVGVTVVAWGPFGAAEFQYDDLPNIVHDGATAKADVLGLRLVTGIRPLLRLSYFLDHALWGFSPQGFRATNLALHVLSVLGVFVLATLRWRYRGVAVAAALIFALQPSHGAVVAYVSGRSTGMMALFLIWALVAWEGRRRYTDHRQTLGLLSLALFLAACLTKEVALVFPLLLVAWELTRDEPMSGRALAREMVPYGGLLAVAAGVVFLSPRMRELLAFSLDLRSPGENLWLQLRAVPSVVSLWLRPGSLSIEHTLPVDSWGASLGGAVALAASGGLAWACRRRAREVTLAILLVWAALIPTCSVIARLDPIDEKALYLAWVGPSILLAVWWARWGRSLSPRTALWGRPAVAASLIAVAAFVCQGRARVWSSERLLWAEAARVAPESTRAWTNLAHAHFVQGEHRQAADAYCRVLALKNDDSAAIRGLMMVAIVAEPAWEGTNPCHSGS